MLLWLIALAVGVALAALQYGRRALESRVLPLAGARALAGALVTALVLGAPGGRSARVVPDVALDASESWLRGSPDSAAWRTALDSARRIGGALRIFGDSLRDGRPDGAPADHASSLRAVADAASSTGRPTVVITDGEPDEPEVLAGMPHGSRTIVIRRTERPDVAISGMDAPRSLLVGDTTTVTITVIAGGVGGPAGAVELLLDDAVLARAELPPLTAYAERAVAFRIVPGGGERGGALRAIVRAAGDAEPRNDTLAVGVDVTQAPGAVFVSTAPDYDAREAIAALRGVTSLPTRAYYRLSPGNWRVEGSLSRAEESAVREAVRSAPLVVLHGDTSAFGPPRAATRGALLLIAPPAADEGEWFASGAPASPLAPAFAALPFDSLPPLDVSADLPHGEWVGLTARRAGAGGERRSALVGWEVPRRVAVLAASGMWRWRFRGGVRADAYAAFFGGLYDWLAAGRTDRRAAVPDAVPVRAGMPIRWRRGAPADSVASVVLVRRGAPARTDSLLLRFAEGSAVAESHALPPGIYDARVNGGLATLVVNESRELLPRRPTVTKGPVGGEPAHGDAPSLRDLGWVYALAILLLCGEWLLRRRVGLR